MAFSLSKGAVAIVALVVACVVCGAAAVLWWLSQTIQLENARALQWRDLKSSEAVLKVAPVPWGWLAGAFVSNDAINKVLRLQEGTRIEVIGLQGFEDLTVDVNHFTLTSTDGPPSITVELFARSATRKLALRLQVKGSLGYKRREAGDGTKPPQAYLGLSVTEFQPKVTWASISFTTPTFMRTVTASGLMQAIGDKLEFPIPLAETLNLPIGKPDSPQNPGLGKVAITVPVKDTGGSVTLSATYVHTVFHYPLDFATPLFTKTGVWLLASDAPFAPPDIPANTQPTDGELKALADSVNAQRSAVPAPKGDLAMFVNQRALTSLVSQVAKLSEPQRTINVVSTAYDKQLYFQRWHDNVLGEGGITVEARRPDFVNATAVIGVPIVTWAPSKGVSFNSSLSANFNTAVHWHFDPLVGGGIGADMNVAGKGAVQLHGTLSIKLVTLDGRAAAILLPSIDCVNVPVEGQENGELKLNVKMGVLAFSKQLAPVLAIDTVPRRVSFETTGEKDSATSQKIKVKPHWANAGLDVVFAPTEALATDSGFWVVTGLAASPEAHGVDPYKSSRESMAAKLEEYAAQMPAPTCPVPDDVRVTVLGYEVGPNGEVVKLFKDAGGVIGHVADEGKKIITTPGKALADFPGNASREIGKGCKNLGLCH